ncbi:MULTISPECIES: DUF3592 domain-containing protein [Arthrobacter]|uniref:DUF3592 domain-containing protein n=2 Tax=Arthrobacter TaxID=1663 RepID=A0ABU9KLW7_9MICC|nr:DUF3592 domain-containing protein [Arthrobacter sp. YJM1]MDP5226451.1 hypothetical protein [Arthrobacter sp. YJM1]
MSKWLWMIWPLAIMMVGLWFLSDSLFARTGSTMGQVEQSFLIGDKKCEQVIGYTVDGTKYKITIDTNFSRADFDGQCASEIGSTAELRYPPSNPSDAHEGFSNRGTVFGSVLTVIGLGGAAGLIWLFRRRNKSAGRARK